MADYTSDQLFIHLDDSNPLVQSAVCDVIAVLANLSQSNKEMIVNKAEFNRNCHRSPAMCDKLLLNLRGYEILS